MQGSDTKDPKGSKNLTITQAIPEETLKELRNLAEKIRNRKARSKSDSSRSSNPRKKNHRNSPRSRLTRSRSGSRRSRSPKRSRHRSWSRKEKRRSPSFNRKKISRSRSRSRHRRNSFKPRRYFDRGPTYRDRRFNSRNNRSTFRSNRFHKRSISPRAGSTEITRPLGNKHSPLTSRNKNPKGSPAKENLKQTVTQGRIYSNKTKKDRNSSITKDDSESNHNLDQEVNPTQIESKDNFFNYEDLHPRSQLRLSDRFRKVTNANLNSLKRALDDVKDREKHIPHLILTNQQLIPSTTLYRQAESLSIVVDRHPVKQDSNQQSEFAEINFSFDPKLHELSIPRSRTEGLTPIMEIRNLAFISDTDEVNSRLKAFITKLFHERTTQDSFFKKFVGPFHDYRDLSLHPLRSDIFRYSKKIHEISKRDNEISSDSPKSYTFSRSNNDRFKITGNSDHFDNKFNSRYEVRLKNENRSFSPVDSNNTRIRRSNDRSRESVGTKERYQEDNKFGKKKTASEGKWSHDKFYELE